jgi:hypothetical protein
MIDYANIIAIIISVLAGLAIYYLIAFICRITSMIIGFIFGALAGCFLGTISTILVLMIISSTLDYSAGGQEIVLCLIIIAICVACPLSALFGGIGGIISAYNIKSKTAKTNENTIEN